MYAQDSGPAEKLTFKQVRFEFEGGQSSGGKLPAYMIERAKTAGLCARRPDVRGSSVMLYFVDAVADFQTKEIAYVFKEREKSSSLGAVPGDQ